MCTARFRLAVQTFSLVLMVNSTHTNLQICTIHLVILSMGMACCHPLACRFFRKTRCLRPRSRLLTGFLNIASQSSHQQSLQLPQEKQKSTTKGRDEVTVQISFMSLTCDLQNSCGENVASYLWDNLCRDIKKIRPQCDPCLMPCLDLHGLPRYQIYFTKVNIFRV